MGKEGRTAEQLRAMAQVRLNYQREVGQMLAADPDRGPKVGEVQPHERDAAGRNWDVSELRFGVGYMDTFRTIVNELREKYDLG